MFPATTQSAKLPTQNIKLGGDRSASWPNLRAFATWFLRDWPLFPIEGGAEFREGPGSCGCIIFRRGAFQVEQIVMRPRHKVGPHCHPTVSSYDIPMPRSSGLIDLSGRMLRPTPRDDVNPLKRRVPILAGVVHSGEAGPNGAEYLSLQHWHEGRAVGFITDDWRDA